MSMSVEQLAPREREVLELVADGLADKEIAARLPPPVTLNTVKGHLKRIYLKLDVNCRTAAAAEWRSIGLKQGRNERGRGTPKGGHCNGWPRKRGLAREVVPLAWTSHRLQQHAGEHYVLEVHQCTGKECFCLEA